MAETSSSAPAAASPGGDGGGRDGCGRGKRRLEPHSPRKRIKVQAEAGDEASAPKVKPAAGESWSGPADANKTTGWLLQNPQGRVVERTAAVIRDAQASFPAAPDTPIFYRNQFLDLWACGRALEVPWDEKWQETPLVMQDSDLANAVQIKLQAPKEAAEEDLTATITKVLKNHPGPVKLFRLDHTACPWQGLLCEWVKVLSAKGVQEFVLLNLTQPMDMEFPLYCLRSQSLRCLALGFFALDWQGACDDELSSLQQLHLAGCQFSGRSLSGVLCRLPCLGILSIGACHITSGCGHQGLIIDSQTLRRLHLWRCTGSALTVANAPVLHVLIAGVTPPPAPAAAKDAPLAVFIDLRLAPVLQELQQLALHYHTLRICSNGRSVKVSRRRVVTMPSLKTLAVGIHVCVPRHASLLVEILCNLPQLQELDIWRVDNLSAQGDDQDCCKAWSLSFVPPCIVESLTHLVVRCYQGGSGEIALVRRVMSTATRLVRVTLHPHTTVPFESTTVFDDCPVASEGCTLHWQ
ncbi:unnamed protein product [Urochloa humidicola]